MTKATREALIDVGRMLDEAGWTQADPQPKRTYVKLMSRDRLQSLKQSLKVRQAGAQPEQRPR